jgi:diguanylate cyclase (GGDEF)-like protein/PAS domain S-box-containing protein
MSEDRTSAGPPAIAAIAYELLPGPVAVLLCRDGRVAFANASAARLFGFDARGHAIGELLADASGATAEPASVSAPLRFKRRDGSDFWAFAAIGKSRLGQLWQILEVDSYVRERDKLAYQESIWRHAIEAAEHGVWDYNANNEGQFYSDAWKAMRGFPIDEEVQDSNEAWEARLHPDDLESVREHVRQQNTGEIDHFNFEYRERRQDGRWIWVLARGRTVEWDKGGKPTRLIGTDIDITDLKHEEAERAAEVEAIYQRHLSELEAASKATESARREAAALARVDPLSGLANRRAFAEEIEQRSAARGEAQGFAVILVDLDRFKAINDMHGHEAGDLVIRQAAIRLTSAVGEGAMVARLGGDEFGVVLPHEGEDAEGSAGACAQKLIAVLSRPFWLGDSAIEIGASAGLAVFPQHSTDADTLFRYADMALYEAKNTARGTWRSYSASLGRAAESRAALEADARRAAAEDKIEPFFQPIVEMRSGNIVKLEMLARWRHPVHGWVAPDRFIPVIEQSGKIADFTLSMLLRACRAARAWPGDISISLNLTTREVCDLATPLRLLGVAMECGFPATRLEVEITEKTIVNDFVAAKQVIAALRNAGVKVLLDDFGAGYAGLGYLRELPFDAIKIDRSFISSLSTKPESFKITNAIQSLAESLGLATVAEGIESLEVWRAVEQLSCTFGQGYYIAKPLPAGEVSSLLGTGPRGLPLAG